MFDLGLSLDDMLTAIDLDHRIKPNPLRATIIPAEDEDYMRVGMGLDPEYLDNSSQSCVGGRLISWANKKIVDLGQNLVMLNPEYESELLFRYNIGLGKDAQHGFHNAFRHGNKKNPDLPINIELHVGYNGYIIEVEDSGDGFPVRKTVDLYHRRMDPNVDPYHTDNGEAFDIFHESISHISYNDKGNIFRVMSLKTEQPSQKLRQ